MERLLSSEMLAARTWTPVLTARQVVLAPGGLLSLCCILRPSQMATTPLMPGSTHAVWTAQLAVFDLATRKDTELTTGLVLNDYMSS